MRDVLGRLEGGPDEVDPTDDDQSGGRRTARSVAPPVLVRLCVGVVEEYEEAENHHTEHT